MHSLAQLDAALEEERDISDNVGFYWTVKGASTLVLTKINVTSFPMSTKDSAAHFLNTLRDADGDKGEPLGGFVGAAVAKVAREKRVIIYIVMCYYEQVNGLLIGR